MNGWLLSQATKFWEQLVTWQKLLHSLLEILFLSSLPFIFLPIIQDSLQNSFLTAASPCPSPALSFFLAS